jgi:hypothetical protein
MKKLQTPRPAGTPLEEGNSFTRLAMMGLEIPPLRSAPVGMENASLPRLNTATCYLLSATYFYKQPSRLFCFRCNHKTLRLI